MEDLCKLYAIYLCILYKGLEDTGILCEDVLLQTPPPPQILREVVSL